MGRTDSQKSRGRRVGLGLAFVSVMVGMGALLIGAKSNRPAIRFELSDVRNEKGHVRCGLFAAERNWLDDDPHASDTTTIRDGRATCVFHDIEPGVYALTALHDEDDNGKMTKSALGLPQEGYAASGGAAREGIGKPDWNDAKFRYDGKRHSERARFVYP